jgi:hypothetical protein
MAGMALIKVNLARTTRTFTRLNTKAVIRRMSGNWWKVLLICFGKLRNLTQHIHAVSLIIESKIKDILVLRIVQ